MRSLSTAYPAEWLALREDADAAARSSDLAGLLRAHLTGQQLVMIRDLGCGTGAMARWLTGKLSAPQHWILSDREPDLLARAAISLPASVTARTELRDLTDLTAADLAGTALVTGSALLDLLTAAEVDDLAAACVEAGCAALFAMSVAGRVEFDPAEELDAELAEAFNDHQRRTVEGRRLLGPDAVTTAAEAFERRGATVHRRPSPWRLGPAQLALVTEWLGGWAAAAVEQRPDLAEAAADYLRRRLDAAAGRGLHVVVHHEDLLALPVGG